MLGIQSCPIRRTAYKLVCRPRPFQDEKTWLAVQDKSGPSEADTRGYMGGSKETYEYLGLGRKLPTTEA